MNRIFHPAMCMQPVATLIFDMKKPGKCLLNYLNLQKYFGTVVSYNWMLLLSLKEFTRERFDTLAIGTYLAKPKGSTEWFLLNLAIVSSTAHSICCLCVDRLTVVRLPGKHNLFYSLFVVIIIILIYIWSQKKKCRLSVDQLSVPYWPV